MRAAAGPVSVEVAALERLALLAERGVLAVVRRAAQRVRAAQRRARAARARAAPQRGAARHARPATHTRSHRPHGTRPSRIHDHAQYRYRWCLRLNIF